MRSAAPPISSALRWQRHELGGPIGVCAVCRYPVSVIGPAYRPAARALAAQPLIGRALQPAARTMAQQPLAAAS